VAGFRDRLGRLGGRGWKWLTLRIAGGLVIVLLLIQAVPYGRDHTNPPVRTSPRWDSPQTEALFGRACGDCHSNLTRWPWYTNVAPASWLVQKDVDDGRSKLNLSELGRGGPDIGDIAEAIRGGMPPFQYTLIHGDASLSSQEKEALIRGLTATLAATPRVAGVQVP
jgi:mono/diheme cytochrome c family protein